MFVFIYRLTSPSGKSYIGQVIEKKGVRERWNQHVRTALHDKSQGSTALNSAILKYGREHFQVETLCKVRTNLKDNVESFCIAFFKTLAPNGYKIRTGSEGYCIDSHPLCKCKKFTSKKFTMNEKLGMAMAYLKELNERIEVQRLVEAVGEST